MDAIKQTLKSLPSLISLNLDIIHQKAATLRVGNVTVYFLNGNPIAFVAPGIGNISSFIAKDNSWAKRYFNSRFSKGWKISISGTPFDYLLGSCLQSAFLSLDEAEHKNIEAEVKYNEVYSHQKLKEIQ